MALDGHAATRQVAGSVTERGPPRNAMQTVSWMRKVGLCSALGACSWAFSPGAAHADGGRAEAGGADSCAEGGAAKDPEAARVAFRAGQTAFSEGGYARAVELWDQAYRDDCTAHALLLNLAMAQELLGRPDDAIHTLTVFNRRSPNSPYVEANMRRIDRLERAAADRRRERSRMERASWTPVERPKSTEAGFGRTVPLIVGVTGAAVTVVGGALFLEGRMSASSADETCGPSRQECAAVEGVVDGERARARAEVGGWMAGAGLITAAGGAVWYLLSGAERPLDQQVTNSGLSLSADLGSRSAGIDWSGRF